MWSMDKTDGPVASNSGQLVVWDWLSDLSHAFFFALETGTDGRDIWNTAGRAVTSACGRRRACCRSRRGASRLLDLVSARWDELELEVQWVVRHRGRWPDDNECLFRVKDMFSWKSR